MKKLSLAIATTLLLALSPAGAQESRDSSTDNPTPPQLTLRINQTHRSANKQKIRETDSSKVREPRPRPHGRSRVAPAPPEKPLIDPKRM